MKRTIAVVTTSRADYSHLYWVLRELREHPAIDLRLVATAAHLSEEFGLALEQIRADGFEVDDTVECLLSSDSDVGMAKTIGVACLGLADVLGRIRPDLLLLIADRYEMLAPASVALALRVPVAHIEGGEISLGAVDDMVRNALTKLAHVHFTSTAAARERVIRIGEEPWRVHHVGAPSLDHLRRSRLLDGRQLEQRLGRPVDPASVLVAYHPVTIARDTLRETDALFEALERVERPIWFSFPNADSGSRKLIRRAEEFCRSRDDAGIFVNLNPVEYWSLLKRVCVMAGNSSSGIMETASLGLPTVNIGLRQQGRERAANVIDCEASAPAIVEALRRAVDPRLRESLAGVVNPYGEGRAAERIVRVLCEVPLGEALLVKRPPSVEPERVEP